MPKKPLTPFFMFYKEKNKKMKEKHSTMSQVQITQMLSIKFKELQEKKRVSGKRVSFQ